MTSATTKPDSWQPAAAMAVDLFDNWFASALMIFSGISHCRFTPIRISGRRIAQLTLNQRVPGSSPGAPTNKIRDLAQTKVERFGPVCTRFAVFVHEPYRSGFEVPICFG
jgi:hypothetical protein